MSVRNWIIALVFGLTSLVGPEYGFAQTASEDDPRQEESTADGEDASNGEQVGPVDISPALDRIESAIRELIAEEDKISAKQAQDRQQRDLQAQEGMARWAEYMFYATAATVILTFFALVAIIRTLYHTRRAADYTEGMLVEAQRTTEAGLAAAGEAKRTNEIAIQNAKTGQRPWIRFDISIERPFTASKAAISNFLDCRVINDGQTPALDLLISWDIHISIVEQDTLTTKFSSLVARNGENGTEPGDIVYPGQFFGSKLAVSMVRDEYDTVKDGMRGTPRIWVSVSAVYRDRHRDRWYKTGLVYEILHARKSGALAMPNITNLTDFTDGTIVFRPTSIALIE